MAKARDRRTNATKAPPAERRKGERRKSTKILEDTPIRRDEDWKKIDSELND